MVPSPSPVQCNFVNPAELLKHITHYRKHLQNYASMEKNPEIIERKQSEIQALMEEKKPFEDEIQKLRLYLERGTIDRIAYRAALNAIDPDKMNLQRRIERLCADIEKIETDDRRRLTYTYLAREFMERINTYIYTYSRVKILLHGEELEYLLVPDIIRQNYYPSEIPLIATNSDLGKMLFGNAIGKVSSSDRRFVNLEIESIQIASDDVLVKLSGIYGESQRHGVTRIKDRLLGGSIQRWRDGARDDAYIHCKRCDSLYPFGSSCNC